MDGEEVLSKLSNVKPFKINDKLEENTNKELDNPVNSESSLPPECVICSTTSPEKSFLYTSHTKLGTSLLVFVEKFIKSALPDQPKLITICKSCYNSVNTLEYAQRYVELYDSTDSDSDSERNKNGKKAKSKIGQPKSSSSNFEPIKNTISKLEPSICNERDTNAEEDTKEPKDNVLPPNPETDQEKAKGNTIHRCNTCERKFLRFSYGTDLMKNRTEARIDCLICQRLFALKPSKRRKPLTDRKPFGCNICKCRFGQYDSLKSHMKYHTRQRPYQCHSCELKFVKRPQFLQHLPKCNLCVCGIMCYQVLQT